MLTFEDELKDRLNTKTFRRMLYNPSGGYISQGQAYEIDHGEKIFVKKCTGEHSRLMFDGEMESLKAINATHTIKAPKPYAVVNDPECELACGLAMEYLDLKPLDEDAAKEVGELLANLHEHNLRAYKTYQHSLRWVGRKVPRDNASTQPNNDTEMESVSLRPAQNSPASKSNRQIVDDVEPVELFGFHVPTSCGAFAQVNEWTKDWVEFYARHRLDYQIALVQRDHGDRQLQENWSKLQCDIGKFFDDLKEDKIFPCLLHGDLWSGNLGGLNSCDSYRSAVYDPSSFYGHSEYDLGIAKMFGGLPEIFYSSYFSIIKQKPNFERRNQLYQLYHHLNHWNHFGSGYRASTICLIQKLNKMYT